jgi:hypothetical protein
MTFRGPLASMARALSPQSNGKTLVLVGYRGPREECPRLPRPGHSG